MRLAVLDHGLRRRGRAFLWIMRAMAGTEDAVVRVSLYRPAVFGRPFLKMVRSVMRGSSDWSPGERELFAAFISGLNACPFCVSVHAGVATLALDPAMTADRLRDWRTAEFKPRVAASLALLEKLTLHPDEFTSADMAPVRAAGLSDAAIVDLLYVCFVFNTINRLANAFGFDWGGDDKARVGAWFLHRFGYRVPGFLLR